MAIFVQNYLNLGSVTIGRFVDGVVQNFPQQVVKTRLTRASDVHSRPFSDRIQALQDLDVFTGICACGQANLDRW